MNIEYFINKNAVMYINADEIIIIFLVKRFSYCNIVV